MPVPELEAVIGAKYRVLRALGAGGMGTVFEVENVLTGKHAAVKWLHPRLQTGEAAFQRMVHEARAMARIRHRNVVDVYDVVVDGDDVCLVMELLHGELLSDRLARAPLYIDELLALLLPAMRGVSAAHAAGVVHRDIKPDNIFLSSEPHEPAVVPKIIDFGISKVFDVPGAAATRSGVTMGTPKYVSYEQLRGAKEVDGRTDVYAFGVILFEALTGRAPYEATSFGEQAIQFLISEPPPIRTLSPAVPALLAELVESAIERERERRPQLDVLVLKLLPFTHPEAFPTRILAFPDSALAATTPAGSPTTRAAEPTPHASARQLAESAPPKRERNRQLWGVPLAMGLGLTLAWSVAEGLGAHGPRTRGAPLAQAPSESSHGAQAGAAARPRSEPADAGSIADVADAAAPRIVDVASQPPEPAAAARAPSVDRDAGALAGPAAATRPPRGPRSTPRSAILPARVLASPPAPEPPPTTEHAPAAQPTASGAVDAAAAPPPAPASDAAGAQSGARARETLLRAGPLDRAEF